MSWDGDDYQSRFDRLAEAGQDVHGEASFVEAFAPTTVLDAGCGTGRVAIELARRGIEVVGVDVDPSMLATARGRAPDLEWIEADLTTLRPGPHLRRRGAGGQRPALHRRRGPSLRSRATCAAHVAPGGHLVAGFSTDRGYTADDWSGSCATAGLTLVDRFATWSGDPFTGGDYAVSVHRKGSVGARPRGRGRGRSRGARGRSDPSSSHVAPMRSLPISRTVAEQTSWRAPSVQPVCARSQSGSCRRRSSRCSTSVVTFVIALPHSRATVPTFSVGRLGPSV